MAWLMLSPWHGSKTVAMAWLTGCRQFHGIVVVAGGCWHGMTYAVTMAWLMLSL